MEREFGNVGRFVLEKHCRNLGIDPTMIEPHDLPRLARILSGLVSRFGAGRAKQVYVEINNLGATDADKDKTVHDEDSIPKLFSRDELEQKILRDLQIKDVSEKLTNKGTKAQA